MSDILKATAKLEEGAKWRGSITADILGEEMDLKVRQLYDPEFRDIRGDINTKEIRDLKDEMPDWVDEYRELQNKRETEEGLTEEEEETYEEYKEDMEDLDIDVFDYLSDKTFGAIQRAGALGVVPSDEDCIEAFGDHEFVREVEEEYGIRVQNPKDMYEPLSDRFHDLIMERSTNMVSFELGMKVLFETAGDEGN